MAISLNGLAANSDIREQLGSTCDFNVGSAGAKVWFTVEGVEKVTVIALDGGGGVFVVMAPSRRVLFVSAEGQGNSTLQRHWTVTV